MPLRAIGLSSIEQSETSKNTVYWLQYWHKPIPSKNGIPVDVLSHPEPTNNIPRDNLFFKFLKNEKPSEEGRELIVPTLLSNRPIESGRSVCRIESGTTFLPRKDGLSS